eukprot:3539716-Amphidinium_carterae.1
MTMQVSSQRLWSSASLATLLNGVCPDSHHSAKPMQLVNTATLLLLRCSSGLLLVTARHCTVFSSQVLEFGSRCFILCISAYISKLNKNMIDVANPRAYAQ